MLLLKSVLIFINILVTVNSIQIVEWTRNGVFYATSNIYDVDTSEINKIQKLGIRGIILSNIQLSDEARKADDSIIYLKEIDMKILVSVDNHFANIFLKYANNTKVAEVEESELSKIRNILNELKLFMTKWIAAKNVDGFVLNIENVIKFDDSKSFDLIVDEIDELLRKLGKKEKYEDEKVLILIVSDEYSFSKIGSLRNKTHITHSLTRPYGDHNKIFQTLLPGIVIIDNENDLKDSQQFLELRKLDVFQNGNVEIINVEENALIVKRELGSQFYLAVMNLQEYPIEISLKIDEKSHEFEIIASSIEINPESLIL